MASVERGDRVKILRGEHKDRVGVVGYAGPTAYGERVKVDLLPDGGEVWLNPDRVAPAAGETPAPASGETPAPAAGEVASLAREVAGLAGEVARLLVRDAAREVALASLAAALAESRGEVADLAAILADLSGGGA